jgi:hypothetical protein
MALTLAEPLLAPPLEAIVVGWQLIDQGHLCRDGATEEIGKAPASLVPESAFSGVRRRLRPVASLPSQDDFGQHLRDTGDFTVTCEMTAHGQPARRCRPGHWGHTTTTRWRDKLRRAP